jgi:hypothetical protein
MRFGFTAHPGFESRSLRSHEVLCSGPHVDRQSIVSVLVSVGLGRPVRIGLRAGGAAQREGASPCRRGLWSELRSVTAGPTGLHQALAWLGWSGCSRRQSGHRPTTPGARIRSSRSSSAATRRPGPPSTALAAGSPTARTHSAMKSSTNRDRGSRSFPPPPNQPGAPATPDV